MGIPFVSLFSGAGGLDLGLEDVQFKRKRLTSALAVEHDPDFAATLKAAVQAGHFKKPFEVLPDVVGLSAEEVGRVSGIARGELQLLAGGPPCPSFSTAGHRQSFADDRGQLVLEYLRLVDELRPRFFVMENVRGILSAALRHRPLAERGAGARPLEADERQGTVVHAYLDEVHRLGYQVVFGKVNAANYGSPQLRHRALFVGSRDHELPEDADILDLLPKTHFESPADESQRRWRTLEDALVREPLHDERPEFQAYSHDRRRWFDMVPAPCRRMAHRNEFRTAPRRIRRGGPSGPPLHSIPGSRGEI